MFRNLPCHLPVLSLLVLAACGPGGVAEAARPEPQTAAEALGETPVDEATCHDVSRGARPLVVDWKPEMRGDLEVAMKEGVAVVKYSCEGIELLTDCHAEGSYGFKGVVLKEQLIRLSSGDEVRANLPLSGVGLAAKLEGEFARGISLNLATALVGKQTSTRLRVGRPELGGRCDGATHFVRSANVGAFVLQTGSAAEISTAAELFGAGASAKSSSSKETRNADGNIGACKRSSSSAEEAPDQCQALVRVQLLPIDEEALQVEVASFKASPPEAAPAPDTEAAECPEGLVLSEGKCAPMEKVSVHVCKPTDLGDCEQQCEAKESTSCSHAGTLYLKSKQDPAQGGKLYARSCELGYAAGCSNLGVLHAGGKGVAQDDGKAAQLFEQACDGGDAIGCFNLASMTYSGRGVSKDLRGAVSLFRQACDAGKAAGCVNLGNAYDDGEGAPKDAERAYSLFKRACEGEEAAGCTSLAYMTAEGRGTRADQEKAVSLYQRGCALGSAQSCESLGNRYLQGKGVARDEAKGKRLLEVACKAGRKSACSK